MLVINQEYKFKFVIPDEYQEIGKDKYQEYGIDDSTLHVFVKMVNSLPHTISINRDDTVKDENDYLSLINLNTENMTLMGMKVGNTMTKYINNRRIDIVTSSYKGLKFVTYFTVIHKMMIASSVEIDEKDSEDEKTLAALFASIEEF